MSPFLASGLSVTSAEFVRHFGVWQDRAANEPVVVTHHGRARLVLLAAQRYQELLQAEAGGGNAEAEHKLFTLLDRLDASFVGFDRHRRLSLLNSQAAAYFKVRRETVIGHEPGEEMPDLARSMARRHVQRTLASGETSMFDAPSLAYPGEWLRFQAFPIGDGAALLFRNVTIEHALRRLGDTRDALASALAMHGGIGTGILSQRARFTSMDATLAAMAGRTPEALDQARLVDLLAPECAADASAQIETVLTRGACRMFEAPLIAEDGERRATRIAIAPIGGDYGIDGAIVVMTPPD